jgi:magnesium transporter
MTTDTFVPLNHVSFEVAAEHASREVPVAAPEQTAGELRRSLVGHTYESASQVVVLAGPEFRGIIRLEDLLAAPDDVKAGDIMDPDPPVVAPGVDQEIASWRAVRRGESALCVVDAGRRFAGLIPPHRLLAVLLAEHEEDLSRLGGFLHSTSVVRQATEEAVWRRFWHRIPWLMVGLAGALLSADMVGWFETRLQEMVALAFFLPGIVYLADAVGTQTETVVVRGLSVGVQLRTILARESATGLVVGLAIALVATPIVLWRWGNAELALGVGLSLFSACSTATLVAMALPWLLDRLGLDPAFGAGPLATVIQDLLSILIYFAIVTAVVS